MPPRVLIVEHEPVVALDLEDAIQEAGYEVAGVASGGGEALAWIRCGRLDLLLVDADLPGYPGATELAQAINHGRDMGLLFLTTHAKSREAVEFSNCLRAGWLLKPFSLIQLHSALRLVAPESSTAI